METSSDLPKGWQLSCLSYRRGAPGRAPSSFRLVATMVVSSTATDDDAAPRVVEDCRGVLQVLSDGTILLRDGFCINPTRRLTSTLPAAGSRSEISLLGSGNTPFPCTKVSQADPINNSLPAECFVVCVVRCLAGGILFFFHSPCTN